MQKDLKDVHKKLNEIKYIMNDRFDVCDIKSNAIESEVVKISKKIRTKVNLVFLFS